MIKWQHVVFAFFAGFLIGGLVREEFSFRDHIFDWQALIAGGAAIVAAMITVHQMRRADAEQERRHYDRVDRELRFDRLNAEKAIVCSERLVGIAQEAPKFEYIGKPGFIPPAEMSANVTNTVKWLRDIDQLLKSDSINFARHLMGPRVIEAMDELQKTIEKCSIIAESCRKLPIESDIDRYVTAQLTLSDNIHEVSAAASKYLETIGSLREILVPIHRHRSAETPPKTVTR